MKSMLVAIMGVVTLLAVACGSEATPTSTLAPGPTAQPPAAAPTSTPVPVATPTPEPTATPAPTPAPVGTTHGVDMTAELTFSPETIAVEVGDTVVWTVTAIGHTTTSGAPGDEAGIWDSEFLAVGETFSFTFTQSGTFPYFCAVHPTVMRGTLTVVEKGAAKSQLPTPSTPQPGSGGEGYGY